MLEDLENVWTRIEELSVKIYQIKEKFDLPADDQYMLQSLLMLKLLKEREYVKESPELIDQLKSLKKLMKKMDKLQKAE